LENKPAGQERQLESPLELVKLAAEHTPQVVLPMMVYAPAVQFEHFVLPRLLDCPEEHRLQAEAPVTAEKNPMEQLVQTPEVE
jgi:hypothetical protein